MLVYLWVQSAVENGARPITGYHSSRSINSRSIRFFTFNKQFSCFLVFNSVCSLFITYASFCLQLMVHVAPVGSGAYPAQPTIGIEDQNTAFSHAARIRRLYDRTVIFCPRERNDMYIHNEGQESQ